MKVGGYARLVVWQKSMVLVEDTYRLTRLLPDEEKFGLTSQARRAAVSIPANVAEGYGRTHRGDYLHHLSVARGSLMELETHLTIAVRLGFLSEEQIAGAWGLCQEVGAMLTGLIESLKK